MTFPVTLPVEQPDTAQLLKLVLQTPMDMEYAAKVPLGTGHLAVGRLRTYFWRVKKRLEGRGKKIPKFKILAEVKPDVPNKCDSIVFKRVLPGHLQRISINMNEVELALDALVEAAEEDARENAAQQASASTGTR